MHDARLPASGLLRLQRHGGDVLRPTPCHDQPDRADPVHRALIDMGESAAVREDGSEARIRLAPIDFEISIGAP